MKIVVVEDQGCLRKFRMLPKVTLYSFGAFVWFCAEFFHQKFNFQM